jgi:hypothetical protein
MTTSRRSLLRQLAAFTGVGAGASLLRPKALAKEADKTRFLIVLSASGGGSIIDGPLCIRASESATPDTLNTFPDEVVTTWSDSPFRAADFSDNALGPIPAGFTVRPSEILGVRRKNLMVATLTGTSVNHQIAQRRSITGNEAWKGRTLQEIVAWQFGKAAPVPNVHLLAGTGYNDNGTDDAVPAAARRQIVADPRTWPLSLDGSKGVDGGLSPKVLDAVRKNRNESFEPATRFAQIFRDSPRLQEWAELRGSRQEKIEALDLITRLMITPNSADFPLSDYGLATSPSADAVRAVFPDFATDPLQAIGS